MTITAKDFAQKMIEWYEDQSGTDSTAQAAELAADLGLTLAPEKPEPGTLWASPAGGFYLRVIDQPEGHDAWFFEDGRVLRSHSTPWQDLTPARVVPAEPVELTEDEVGEIYEAESMNYHWDDLPTSSSGMRPKDMQQDITLTVNAAIAKHGGARELPDSLQVCKAIDSGFSLAEQTDAVMALLKGGDRD